MPVNHCIPHTEAVKEKIRAAKAGKPALWKRRASINIDGVTLWQCGRCLQFFTRDGFYKNKRTLLGLKNECKACHIETSIASRNKDTARDTNRDYMRRARASNLEAFRSRERRRVRPKDHKSKARELLNRAVRNNRMAKPETCAGCGAPARLAAHHHDYSKPLDVTWLCSLCHGKRHRKS